MSWAKHLPGVKSQLYPGLARNESPAEKTERIDEYAHERRLNAVQNYRTPTPEEVREHLKRRSRRTKRALADQRYQTKVKYDIDELNLTALRAPHVEREMSLSTKGGKKRHSKTRKQRHFTKKLSIKARLRASSGRERKRA
jgi:hypothetical protein